MTTEFPPRAPLRALAAPLLLGFGLGAWLDGIVFQQLLQWHLPLSSSVPPVDGAHLSLNLRAAGVFNLGAWLLVLVAVALLFGRASARLVLPSRREFGGALLVGAGVFNTLEGIINHLVLNVHDLREVADPLLYNLGHLLLAGALPVFIGVWIVRGRFPS